MVLLTDNVKFGPVWPCLVLTHSCHLLHCCRCFPWRVSSLCSYWTICFYPSNNQTSMKQEPPALADATIFGKPSQEKEWTELSNTHSARTANGIQQGVPTCFYNTCLHCRYCWSEPSISEPPQISMHWIVVVMTEQASGLGPWGPGQWLGLSWGYAQLCTCVPHIFCISAPDCCRQTLRNTVQPCSHCSSAKPSISQQECDTKMDTAWSSCCTDQCVAQVWVLHYLVPRKEVTTSNPYNKPAFVAPCMWLRLSLTTENDRNTVSIRGGDVGLCCSQHTSPSAVHWNLGRPTGGHLQLLPT